MEPGLYVKMSGNNWMVSYPDSAILHMDKQEGTWKRVDDYPAGFSGNGYAFAMGFMREDSFYACPVKANMMLETNREAGCMQEVQIKGMIMPEHTLMYLSGNDRYFVFNRYRSDKSVWIDENVMQVFLDRDKLQAFEWRFQIKNKNERDSAFFQTYLAKKEVIIENGQFQLSWLFTMNPFRREPASQNLCSARIHKEIGRLL